jgi:synaptobrevin family protein YKT6
MKIVSIGLLKWRSDTLEPIILAQEMELSNFGFFQRGSVAEMIRFFCRTFVKRTPHGTMQSVQHEEYNIHIYLRTDGLAGVVVSDLEYPSRVAMVLISKMFEDFTSTATNICRWEHSTSDVNLDLPFLKQALMKFQNPSEADKLTKIQRELDQTTVILQQTIASVLDRGVKLDDLVNKSNDLSNQSKIFYRRAKETNSCCVIN